MCRGEALSNDNFINNIGKIEDIDIRSEMKKSYIDYAMSVIVSRALPDVRDGLKPVHRRIIYSMSELGLTHDKKYRKSARIIGDVLGKYHPHGDSAVYNAMVRMAQPFSMRYELVDGQGNFGSIDGDGAAAHRYTEAKMTKLTSELLRDINKNTVDFKPNFDEEENEPVVLPARFPNLLVNGTNGIAVGMATTIPPHNLKEVVDATVKLMDDENITDDELISCLNGPDFPTGATMLGTAGYRKAYKTGKGRVVLRSKYEIEELKNGKSRIVITEIPYQVNKAKCLESIAEMVQNKTLDGITALRDESNRDGIRIVIETRKDVNANVMINQLFKKSQLQSSINMNMIALVDGEPKLLSLREILTHYINHQVDVETRRVLFDLDKAKKRAHILEGYIIAIDDIDNIIRIIRSSYNEAEQNLMKEYDLSEIQAKAICDMRLRRLQGLEREKIENELKSLYELIEHLNLLLEDRVMLLDLIRKNLLELAENFSDERRTDVEFDYSDIDEEDLIEEKMVSITLTKNGYIKRTALDAYSTQKRGGRGITGLSTRDEDVVIDIFTCSTHDYLMFVSNLGKSYRLKAYKVPESSRTALGTALINLLSLENGEKIKAIIPFKEFDDNLDIVMVTKYGLIKKTAMSDYDTNYSIGLRAIKLRDNDEVVSAVLSQNGDDLFIVTHQGKAIRISEDEVRRASRNTYGVKSISLRSGDFVVGAAKYKANSSLLVVSENGYGKKTAMDEYRRQTRGGYGNLTYKISEKTGSIISCARVEDEDEIILVNSNGIIIRISVGNIAQLSRNTSGVKLMRVQDGVKVISFAIIKAEFLEKDDDENDSEKVEEVEIHE